MQLDLFDKKILEMMQRNCRLQTERMAEQIGLSASAVQRRIKKMRQEGVIQQEVAIIDPQYLTNQMSFLAGLEIERDNYQTLSHFKSWAAQKDNIQQIYYVTGQFDLMVLVTAATALEYDAFIEKLMQENPKIRRVTTHVVLDSPKRSFYTPVKDHEYV
ncbi:Lrp/AsnC family transcriptional regulator [Vibrio rhizosphaerae]|uniref:Lrp/AsnC family transcriptional regulator n=1 Tax=Vibrio rhizosphaerae TaxID=398736 RepID=A0ABU4ITW4_9VIBR|nr:Lrp/AsnC family transcriptional regulator [Vibrio rhizosphaerae]MDW6092765.1 Lrp/AsnC family transcriptional regulator [Vibrio rhizosphaerae]